MKATQRVCDACGELIIGPGKDGKVVRKPHLYLKGVLSKSSYQTNTRKWRFAYATITPTDGHVFCNIKCLQKQIENREDDFVRAPNLPTHDVLRNAETDG